MVTAAGYAPLMLRRLLPLLPVLLLAHVAYGWGGEGHQVVALIAENHLSAAAKAGIHELLGQDVNISDAEVCNWADQIRRQRHETAPWHYVTSRQRHPASMRPATATAATTSSTPSDDSTACSATAPRARKTVPRR